MCVKVQCSSLSHYEVLGVAPACHPDGIKAAFRKAAKALHPDVNKLASAEQSFVRVRLAYKVLSDPALRSQYDIEIGTARAATRTVYHSAGGSAPQGQRVGWMDAGWVVDADSSLEEDGDSDSDVDDWFENGDDGDLDDFGEEDVLDAFNWGPAAARMGAARVWTSLETDPWSAETKRHDRQREQARAEAERLARLAGAAAGHAYAATAAARRQAAHSSRSLRRDTLAGFSPEDVLRNLGPEAQVTARNLFGTQLERLESIEQLSDFAEVLEVLRCDMGMQFEVFADSTAAGGRTSRSWPSSNNDVRAGRQQRQHRATAAAAATVRGAATQGEQAPAVPGGSPASGVVSSGATSRMKGPGAVGNSVRAGSVPVADNTGRRAKMPWARASQPQQQHQEQGLMEDGGKEQVRAAGRFAPLPWQQQQQRPAMQQVDETEQTGRNATRTPLPWQRPPPSQQQSDGSQDQRTGQQPVSRVLRQQLQQQQRVQQGESVPPDGEFPSSSAGKQPLPKVLQRQQRSGTKEPLLDVVSAMPDHTVTASGVRKPWARVQSPAKVGPKSNDESRAHARRSVTNMSRRVVADQDDLEL